MIGAKELAALPDKAFRAQLMNKGKLTVCMSRNNGVLSGRRVGGGSGFDYKLSERIAKELGLKLEVVWFEIRGVQKNELLEIRRSGYRQQTAQTLQAL